MWLWCRHATSTTPRVWSGGRLGSRAQLRPQRTRWERVFNTLGTPLAPHGVLPVPVSDGGHVLALFHLISPVLHVRYERIARS